MHGVMVLCSPWRMPGHAVYMLHALTGRRCCMQNLVDSLGQRFRAPVPQERHGELNTFVVFNRRRRVTSSAKRRRQAGSLHLAQTPDGSFLDLQRNAAELLQHCGFLGVPEVFIRICNLINVLSHMRRLSAQLLTTSEEGS